MITNYKNILFFKNIYLTGFFGVTGYKMKKRVGAIEEFEFETLVMIGKQLHITIAITGWLSNEMQGNLT